jgi:hypothetical protein
MNNLVSIVWNPNLSSAAANATVIVGPPADDYSPNTIAGLTHWWRADSLLTLGLGNGAAVGAPGASWIDLVSGVLAFQTSVPNRPSLLSPAINNRPAVQFNCFFSNSIAQRLSLDLPFSITGDFTTLAVLKTANISGVEASNDWFSGAPQNPGLGARHVATPPAYNARMRIDGGANQNFGTFPAADDSLPHLIAHRRSSVTGVTQAFFNGGSPQGLNLDGPLTINSIGGASFGFSQNISLVIAELLHFSTALSDADMATLYASYFKPRYALP